MTRVAAIDCGTNSLRLLIADAKLGRLAEVLRRMEIVRLGAGVDRTGLLSPAALERARVVLADYGAELKRHQPRAVRMVATSAVRDATNVAEFDVMVQDTLGIAAEVVTGEVEAELSYLGAVGELDPAAGPFLVVDIGGGSTELVYGEGSGVTTSATSLDVGAVRLTERYFHDDPPTREQIAGAEQEIQAALAQSVRVPLRAARTVVGVAGSVTTVVGLALGLPEYNRDRIHHARVPARRVVDVSTSLLEWSQAQRAAYKVIHPGRADVIAAGALILREVLLATGASELLCSEQDILDGVALELMNARRRRLFLG